MASTGNPAVVCVHAGFGQARLIGMVLFAAATFFAFQDIVKNQVNARRSASIVNGMQALVIDLIDLPCGDAECLSPHFEKNAIVGNDWHVHSVRVRQ